MEHAHTVEEAQELAALYALGTLRGEERSAFERHVAEGCVTCAAEAAAFGGVVESLAYAPSPQPPRPEVRTRVLERIATESLTAERPTVEKDRLSFVRSQWLNWQPGNAPGVEIKLLSFDHTRNYFTTLVRMAPGARLAPHRHADIEESYVLEGELLISGVLMRTGDYCRAEAGSMHAGIFTKTGCTFIAVASTRDEWFPLNQDA